MEEAIPYLRMVVKSVRVVPFEMVQGLVDICLVVILSSILPILALVLTAVGIAIAIAEFVCPADPAYTSPPWIAVL